MTIYEYDLELFGRYPVFAGVDEAGRGPLAGDVYAAAVIFDSRTVIEGVNDSKKLTEKKREALYDIIISSALDYSIATASPEEIDSLNILEATMLAMLRAVSGLKMKPNAVFVDGNRAPKLDLPSFSVVKGDSLSQSIAAASILAKVSRDRYISELDLRYPEYGFSSHKGYGTKKHYEALRKYGPTPVHRKSFLKSSGGSWGTK
ncbi:MAG TPA: ribonuclease HII [Candidatus Faeciplasma avium]|uniref:Ribonuclease HII n=1 Tax=Candidatus Faeciplasma avium TaxID=2840798 RepID=A0A9D1NRA2_9FIRM|nr:ribonuclease HII [Candidatus Faeciplasma avium]